MLKPSSIILLLLLIVGVILWQWRFAMPPLPTVSGPDYPPLAVYREVNTCTVGDWKSVNGVLWYCVRTDGYYKVGNYPAGTR